jgi:hypothetical protein
MMVNRSHVKTAGWAAVLLGCASAVAMLMFKVNAVRSEVRNAEERIVELQRDNLYLETEFETRASQQQLAAFNRMEFGYVAPGPGQFLANERALAAFAEPRANGAPQMIRVARDIADVELASFAGEVAEAVAADDAKPELQEREPDPQPSFQRAVVEKVDDEAREKAQPSFAALFAEYRLDDEASE